MTPSRRKVSLTVSREMGIDLRSSHRLKSFSGPPFQNRREQSHPPPMPHSFSPFPSLPPFPCAMPNINSGALRSERAVSGRGGGPVAASTCREHGKHAWNLPLQTPTPSHRTRREGEGEGKGKGAETDTTHPRGACQRECEWEWDRGRGGRRRREEGGTVEVSHHRYGHGKSGTGDGERGRLKG